MNKETKEVIKRTISFFLGLMSWYSIFQINISNLIEDSLTNFAVAGVLVLLGVILIAYAISPMD